MKILEELMLIVVTMLAPHIVVLELRQMTSRKHIILVLLLSAFSLVFLKCTDDVSLVDDSSGNKSIVVIDSIVVPTTESASLKYGGVIDYQSSKYYSFLSDSASYYKVWIINKEEEVVSSFLLERYGNDGVGGQLSSFGADGKSLLFLTDKGSARVSPLGEVLEFQSNPLSLVNFLDNKIHVLNTSENKLILSSHGPTGEGGYLTTQREFYDEYYLFSSYSFDSLKFMSFQVPIEEESHFKNKEFIPSITFSSTHASFQDRIVVVHNPYPQFFEYEYINSKLELINTGELPTSHFQLEMPNQPTIKTLYATSSFTGTVLNDKSMFFSYRTGVPPDLINENITPENGFEKFVEHNRNFLVRVSRDLMEYNEIELPRKLNLLLDDTKDDILLFSQNVNEVESEKGTVFYFVKIQLYE